MIPAHDRRASHTGAGRLAEPELGGKRRLARQQCFEMAVGPGLFLCRFSRVTGEFYPPVDFRRLTRQLLLGLTVLGTYTRWRL